MGVGIVKYHNVRTVQLIKLYMGGIVKYHNVRTVQ